MAFKLKWVNSKNLFITTTKQLEVAGSLLLRLDGSNGKFNPRMNLTALREPYHELLFHLLD